MAMGWPNEGDKRIAPGPASESGMSERKRLIKAARQVPVERVRELLRRDDDLVDDYFLVYNRDLDHWSICCWSRTNGMMEMAIDDGTLALAAIEYMKNHGHHQFKSDAEASAHIETRGWTCSRSRPGKNAD
jgi:hypothetical protein